MFFSGIITARVLRSILERGFKIAAGRGAMLVVRAHGKLANFSLQSRAAGLVLTGGSFHAAGSQIQIFGQVNRHFKTATFFRFHPVKLNAEGSTAGSAFQAGIKPRFLVHAFKSAAFLRT